MEILRWREAETVNTIAAEQPAIEAKPTPARRWK
jgi:hypothetical protein